MRIDTAVVIVIVASVLLVSNLLVYEYASVTGFGDGLGEGLLKGTGDMARWLNGTQQTYFIIDYGNGSFGLKLNATGGTLLFSDETVYHCDVAQYRNGVLISQSNHPMTKTMYGMNVTKQLYGNQTTAGFMYFAISNDTTTPTIDWTALPSEYASGGLSRVAATYVDTGNTTSTSTWNFTHTFTVSASTATSQMYGVYTSVSGSNLCLAEQQGAGSIKNLIAGDVLVMTVQGEAS